MAAVRVIDTGIRSGRENVAFDQALIEAHNAARIPQTIRFLRFRPAALVGLHQILSHEVRLEYCARHGIEVGRRITGGGGLYLDQDQVCWELVLERKRLAGDLASIAARICSAAATSRIDSPLISRQRVRCDSAVENACRAIASCPLMHGNSLATAWLESAASITTAGSG